MTLRDVASSSCTVVVALLRDLTQTSSSTSSDHSPAVAVAVAGDGNSVTAMDLMAPSRSLWTKAVAAAVCSTDLKLRTNSADYLVPELLKVDNTCGPHLMQEIRSVCSSLAHSHTATHAGADDCYGGMLWGLVQVTLHARALTLPGKDIVFQGSAGVAELSDQEVLWACLSADFDLRLAALTLLTGTLPLEYDITSSIILSLIELDSKQPFPLSLAHLYTTPNTKCRNVLPRL